MQATATLTLSGDYRTVQQVIKYAEAMNVAENVEIKDTQRKTA